MIVDIHAHLSPPSAAQRFPMPPSLTDVDAMLAARDEAGVDLTVIGSPVGAGAMMRVPGVDNYAQGRDRLRVFHDWMAGLVDAHSDRLRAYVYANPLGDEDHLAGVRETLENPAFVGFVINSSVRGEFLDNPAADGFFALAAEVRKPILVHPPAEPAGANQVGDMRFVEQVSRFCDVTAGLAMIAYAGWLRKYPDLVVIGATAGGGIAALPEKLRMAAQWPKAAAGMPDFDPAEDVRRLYVDTAGPSRDHLEFNRAVFGADHMLFGTDSPPAPVSIPTMIESVRALPISIDEQDAILGGNAERLLGLTAPQFGGNAS